VLADQRLIACGTAAEVLAVDHPFIQQLFQFQARRGSHQTGGSLAMENRSHALIAGLFTLLGVALVALGSGGSAASTK
jgi:hypothetical protein